MLVDLSLFSRNEWVYWDMFSRPITGTLAYNDNTFVASFNLDTDKQIIGELDTKRGLNGNIRVRKLFSYVVFLSCFFPNNLKH